MTKFTQKNVAEEFDRYKDNYSETVEKSLLIPGLKADYFTRVKAYMLIEHAERLFGNIKDISVLDVGCGVGNYHYMLSGKFKKLVGIDVSEGSIENAKQSHPEVEYISYDGFKMPFEDETFDLAYAICVAHHVPPDNWPNFFSEMHRILKPNGRAIIFEHNPYNPLTMHVVNNCPFDDDAVLLKPKKTKELLLGANFNKVDSRTILTIPSFGPLTRKLDQLLGVLPFGAQYYSIGAK